MGDNASAPAAERWLPARLIPTGGIKGQQEQESRATSVLLAVIKAVPEFAQAILRPLGAPKGQVSTFVEVPLKGADGKVHRRPKAPKLREPEPVTTPTPSADADPEAVWASIDDDPNLSDLEKYRLKVKHMEERDQAGAGSD